jgi:hypothetical protein
MYIHLIRYLKIVTILFLIFLPESVYSKDINFEASVNRNIVSLGQSVQLNLQFHGSTDIPAPELPEIEGFKSRYVGPSTMMSIVNGKMSSSITHIYRLIPLKTGKFKIGPLSFKYKGDTYVSNELTIEVVDSSISRERSSQKQQKRQISLKDRLFLEMKAGKSRVYLNEIIPLTIKLYISNLGVRDIQYPEINFEGFSADKFDKPRQYQETKNGIIYDVVEFRTNIFGTKPGKFTLGPAKIQANLIIKNQMSRRRSLFDDFFGRDPFFDDFFGRYELEPIELSSEKIPLTVLPLPEKDRPDDFAGAIGNFNLNIEVSPKQVKTGDPVTLKMIITGEGNFNTVTSPKLAQQKNFKVYEPQVRQEGNKKIFEQILIPTTDSIKEIPPVTFSFFNTSSGKYQTISKGPVPIIVTKPEKKEEITIMEAPQIAKRPLIKEKFGRDIIYIKESPGNLKRKGDYLYKNIFFLLAQIIPLLLLLSAWLIHKRREKLSSDIGYARRLSAPKKAKKGIHKAEKFLNDQNTAEFYDSIFKTLKEYIGDRFHLPSGGITADIVDDTLRTRGINENILTRIKDIFMDCDMARYAPAEFDTTKMKKTLQDLKEVINYLERNEI